MLAGNTGTPNLILLLAGLLLVVAGGAAIHFREGIAEYLRDLRSQIFGEPLGRGRGRDAKKPGPPVLPVVVAVALIGLGLVGVYGGLFAELPPPGTRPI
jgi:hypothetical protein